MIFWHFLQDNFFWQKFFPKLSILCDRSVTASFFKLNLRKIMSAIAYLKSTLLCKNNSWHFLAKNDNCLKKVKMGI